MFIHNKCWEESKLSLQYTFCFTWLRNIKALDLCSPWPEKYIDWWININRFETVWELQPSTLPIQEIISLQPFHCFHTKTDYWSKWKELSWLALLGWYNFIMHGYSKSKSALRKLISTTVTRQSTWCILLKNQTKYQTGLREVKKSSSVTVEVH